MRTRLIALFVSSVLSLVLVEGALHLLYESPSQWVEPQTRHLVDPTLGWILPRNDQSFTIDAPVSTNSLGLRDDEFPIEKPDGEIRILCLGDSFTFALGVRFEDLYVQILEGMLAERHPGRRFQVINAGVAGYNTTQELVFLQADGLRYDPDLIVVGFYWNDLIGNAKPLPAIDGPINRDRPAEPEPATDQHSLPRWIRDPLRKSLVLYLGVTRIKNVIAALDDAPNETIAVQRAILAGDAETLAPRWTETGERLRALAAVAAERQIPVLLMSFPMENHVRMEAPPLAYDQALAEAWRPTGQSMVDLAPAYRSALQEGRNPFLPYDLHPGRLGMEIAADAIYSAIRSRGLLPLAED